VPRVVRHRCGSAHRAIQVSLLHRRMRNEKYDARTTVDSLASRLLQPHRTSTRTRRRPRRPPRRRPRLERALLRSPTRTCRRGQLLSMTRRRQPIRRRPPRKVRSVMLTQCTHNACDLGVQRRRRVWTRPVTLTLPLPLPQRPAKPSRLPLLRPPSRHPPPPRPQRRCVVCTASAYPMF
jgi:hypothetical protein